MRYNLYARMIVNEDDFVDFSDYKIHSDWYLVSVDTSLDEVWEVLGEIMSTIYPNAVFVILPNIEEGDRVLNINTQTTGRVLYFDKDITPAFDIFDIDDGYEEIKGIDYNIVTVQKDEGGLVTWMIKDLIVID